VPLDPQALHTDACFILDTEHAIYHYVGASAPIKVFAAAYQIAAALHFRERTGRVPAALVTVNHGNDPEAEEVYICTYVYTHTYLCVYILVCIYI
jgi:hypothetical protein